MRTQYGGRSEGETGMTWCKGCKKDVSPSLMDKERGFCDDCVALGEAMCESGDYCDKCPELAKCEADE